VISLNSGEPSRYPTPVEASKIVADNIFAGNSATVVFENASDLQTVRQNFNLRVGDALRKLGCDTGFGYEPSAIGATYRPK
jgi:hypothetical protein